MPDYGEQCHDGISISQFDAVRFFLILYLLPTYNLDIIKTLNKHVDSNEKKS